MVNAQRFRARKVDFKRALPVYRASDLEDLEDDDNRQTDTIETGVEKDEEAVTVISAAQAAATGSAPSKQMYIPTPDATRVVEGYDERYPKTFTCPTSLIRSSETVEESCAAMYCMDDEDAQWLARTGGLTAELLESAMDQLETLTRDMVFQTTDDIPTLERLAAHAADRERAFDAELCARVYEHWRARRAARGFQTINAVLQQEDTSKTEIDPYVCFRRREVQRGRKTRRADQRSLEQLRRLRINLAMAAQVLELCLEREAAKMGLAGAAAGAARQRSEVVRMRRRVGATSAPWDELFVAPVQQGARKRLVRDPAQRARVAAARKAKAGPSGGDPALPLPFVLPRTVSVQQYAPARRLLSMQSRIQTKTHVCESRLGAWVDATWADKHTVASPQGAWADKQSAFWAPDDASPLAFRLRRARCGRMFVDRRVVRAHAGDAERQQRFRLGLLCAEDHQRLRECRTGAAPLIPDALLQPFSFAAALQPMPELAPLAVSAASSDTVATALRLEARPSLSACTQDSSEPATPTHMLPLKDSAMQIASSLPLGVLSPRMGRESATPLPNTAKCN
ncbi:Enhancer of polycomb-like protein 1 [Coemansia sp. RSA 2618]|nr:Enhancer of polycomb-like protein 1 [Coemansia sp. RSA 2618]